MRIERALAAAGANVIDQRVVRGDQRRKLAIERRDRSLGLRHQRTDDRFGAGGAGGGHHLDRLRLDQPDRAAGGDRREAEQPFERMAHRAVAGALLVGEVGERLDPLDQLAPRPEHRAREEAPVGRGVGGCGEARPECGQQLGIAELVRGGGLVEGARAGDLERGIGFERRQDCGDLRIAVDQPAIEQLAPFGGIAGRALLGVELADEVDPAFAQERQRMEQRGDIPAAVGHLQRPHAGGQPIERGAHLLVERADMGGDHLRQRAEARQPLQQLQRDLGVIEVEDDRGAHQPARSAPAIRRTIWRA